MYPKKKKNNPSPYTVWRWLETLRDLENLSIKTCNKYSIVTVSNYDTYQNAIFQDEQQNEQHVSNRRATGEQQVSTIEEGKESKEREEENIPATRRRNRRFSDADLVVAKEIWGGVLLLKADAQEPNLEAWANDVRMMAEIDGRTHDQIRDLFAWANRHTFWAANILSPSKLRKQWDRLEIQRNAEHGRTGRTATTGSGSKAGPGTLFDPESPTKPW